MNWLVIFTVAAIGLFGFIGYMRGLVKSVLGTSATIVALALAYLLTPAVSQWIQDHTSIDDSINNKIYSTIEKKVDDTISGTGEQLKKTMNVNPDKQSQIEFIRELSIPDFLEEHLLDKNNSDGYEKLGVSNVYSYISRRITIVIVNLIAGVITFIVLRMLLLIVNILISKSVSAIPVVNAADKIGGVAAGVALGVIIVWLLMFVLSFIINDETYRKLLQDNVALQWLNDKNVITRLCLRG